MNVYLVKLIDPEDEDYVCEYTIAAADEAGAMAFAEKHNPGKKCTSAVLQT